MCSGLVYQKDTCHCHMDQCLEAVRYNHIEKCGTTTLPPPPTPPPSDDGEGSGGGGEEGSGSGDSSDNGGVMDPSEFILELSEEELLLRYADMFNFVKLTFMLFMDLIDYFSPFQQRQQQPQQRRRTSTAS